MTAGESPVAKWKQYRINITLTWSSGFPGTQMLNWGSSEFFHYAFFKGHLYHISSVFILSDHILFVSGAEVRVDHSSNVNLNKCPRTVQIEAFEVNCNRWSLVAEAFKRTLRRWPKLTCWSETCVRGATAHMKTAGCHGKVLGCAACPESRADTSIIRLIRPSGTHAKTEHSVPQKRCHLLINILFYSASIRPNLLNS